MSIDFVLFCQILYYQQNVDYFCGASILLLGGEEYMLNLSDLPFVLIYGMLLLNSTTAPV